MAKQNRSNKSYYTGANQALVKGAGMVGATQNQSFGGVDFSSQFSALSATAERNKTIAAQKREQTAREANEAYSVLSNMNFEGILPGMYDGVQQTLMPLAKESADLKLRMNNVKDPEQKALLQSEVNKIDAQIKRYTSQVKDLSKNALDQLDYNRSQDRSAGNDEDYVSAINKIFSGQATPLLVNGELAFDINGAITPYNSLENVDPKASAEFTAYSDSIGNAENAREELSSGKIDAYKSQWNSKITQDNIVSLGMDDFGLGKTLLGDQFETIEEWKDFSKSNYSEAKKILANRLTENYVNTANKAAAEYKRKNPPSGSSDGGDFQGYANTQYGRLHVASGLLDSDIQAINYTLKNPTKSSVIRFKPPGSTIESDYSLIKSGQEWYFAPKGITDPTQIINKGFSYNQVNDYYGGILPAPGTSQARSTSTALTQEESDNLMKPERKL